MGHKVRIRNASYTTTFHFVRMADSGGDYITGLTASYDTALRGAVAMFERECCRPPFWQYTTVTYTFDRNKITCNIEEVTKLV
jgi:hypothetical protein